MTVTVQDLLDEAYARVSHAVGALLAPGEDGLLPARDLMEVQDLLKQAGANFWADLDVAAAAPVAHLERAAAALDAIPADARPVGLLPAWAELNVALTRVRALEG